jgi:hypothetical protein
MAFYSVMDHKISHNSRKKLGTTDRRTVIIATILLVTVAVLLLSLSYSSQANAQNKTQSQKSGNATTTNATTKTTGGAGSAKQLSQLGAGANNQILGNNTDIGNPNAGKAASTQEKINASTPKTGLPSNPTGKGQKQ